MNQKMMDEKFDREQKRLQNLRSPASKRINSAAAAFMFTHPNFDSIK